MPLESSSQTTSKESFSPFLASIIVLVHVVALGAIFYYSTQALILFVIFHIFFSVFGIALGHHRLFSHRSFSPTSDLLTNFLGTVATLCFQGGPFFWASVHRAHHRHAEQIGDAHSAARGFLWSHVGWMCYRNPNGFSYIKARKTVIDLSRNWYLVWLEKNAIRLNVAVMGAAFLLALYFGRLDLFFWLGPLRIVSVWHATWLINSYAHNTLPFLGTKIGATNSYAMSFILGGEGFHKFHHDNPSKPVYGPLTALDFSGWLLLLMEKIGLVRLRRTNRI